MQIRRKCVFFKIVFVFHDQSLLVNCFLDKERRLFFESDGSLFTVFLFFMKQHEKFDVVFRRWSLIFKDKTEVASGVHGVPEPQFQIDVRNCVLWVQP